MARDVHTFEDIITSNVYAALDQRGDTKNYATVTEVLAAYLQNAQDTVKGYKVNASPEAVYGAFCRELAEALKHPKMAAEFPRVPDGFRI